MNTLKLPEQFLTTIDNKMKECNAKVTQLANRKFCFRFMSIILLVLSVLVLFVADIDGQSKNLYAVIIVVIFTLSVVSFGISVVFAQKLDKLLYKYNVQTKLFHCEADWVSGVLVKLCEPYSNIYDVLSKLKKVVEHYDGKFSVEKSFDISDGSIEYRIRGDETCNGSLYLIDKTGAMPEKAIMELDFSFLDSTFSKENDL